MGLWKSEEARRKKWGEEASRAVQSKFIHTSPLVPLAFSFRSLYSQYQFNQLITQYMIFIFMLSILQDKISYNLSKVKELNQAIQVGDSN